MSSAEAPGMGERKRSTHREVRKERSCCLDTVQLNRLEQSFRRWAEESPRRDVRASRRRILVIFLLIRYTAGKLSEVLMLNPLRDINYTRPSVLYGGSGPDASAGAREVPISESLLREILSLQAGHQSGGPSSEMFLIDPAFVRRKFYERALDCGFAKELGSPEMIRKARGAELMHGSMPLPAVQKLLGHSTPNLTSSYVSFTDDDVRRISKYYMDKEASRKTSARNCFFGKVHSIQRGDIQSHVELVTLDDNRITTVITNESIDRLGLRKGALITAEVKAPWVLVHKGPREPVCSAENRFRGTVDRINLGRINTEYILRISAQTELCSVITTRSSRLLDLKVGDSVWALFNSFAVVLHTD